MIDVRKSHDSIGWRAIAEVPVVREGIAAHRFFFKGGCSTALAAESRPVASEG
jgi:hypothetical protein